MNFNITDFLPRLFSFGYAETKKNHEPSYEMTILNGGFVYCVIPIKYDLVTDKIRDNRIPIDGQYVIKVGMSSYEHIDNRLKRYGPGTLILAKIFCMNYGTMEKIMLEEFRKQFKNFVGAEYFNAKPDEALHLFLKIYAANVTGAVGSIKLPTVQPEKLKKKQKNINQKQDLTIQKQFDETKTEENLKEKQDLTSQKQKIVDPILTNESKKQYDEPNGSEKNIILHRSDESQENFLELSQDFLIRWFWHQSKPQEISNSPQNADKHNHVELK